jgi:hypothetical protein
MTELLIEFEGRGEVRGFQFKQLKKSTKAYLYQKRYEDIAYFEVFRCKISAKFHCIIYPGSKSFGLWAWDYREYDKAMRKFNAISGTELSD